eukprot:TRINITY_DN27360_c0_g2_i1.p1 TRINITY_DN27360_c0_g2~~TRINITY_DN27360_c0_g2_i1.p1  ORF type:complete len:669 (+),score=107.02 TRINITY_DN27360_c0_g2_i1:61-2067(+)
MELPPELLNPIDWQTVLAASDGDHGRMRLFSHMEFVEKWISKIEQPLQFLSERSANQQLHENTEDCPLSSDIRQAAGTSEEFSVLEKHMERLFCELELFQDSKSQMNMEKSSEAAVAHMDQVNQAVPLAAKINGAHVGMEVADKICETDDKQWQTAVGDPRETKNALQAQMSTPAATMEPEVTAKAQSSILEQAVAAATQTSPMGQGVRFKIPASTREQPVVAKLQVSPMEQAGAVDAQVSNLDQAMPADTPVTQSRVACPVRTRHLCIPRPTARPPVSVNVEVVTPASSPSQEVMVRIASNEGLKLERLVTGSREQTRAFFPTKAVINPPCSEEIVVRRTGGSLSSTPVNKLTTQSKEILPTSQSDVEIGKVEVVSADSSLKRYSVKIPSPRRPIRATASNPPQKTISLTRSLEAVKSADPPEPKIAAAAAAATAAAAAAAAAASAAALAASRFKLGAQAPVSTSDHTACTPTARFAAVSRGSLTGCQQLPQHIGNSLSGSVRHHSAISPQRFRRHTSSEGVRSMHNAQLSPGRRLLGQNPSHHPSGQIQVTSPPTYHRFAAWQAATQPSTKPTVAVAAQSASRGGSMTLVTKITQPQPQVSSIDVSLPLSECRQLPKGFFGLSRGETNMLSGAFKPSVARPEESRQVMPEAHQRLPESVFYAARTA